jgi:hypothetical protein
MQSQTTNTESDCGLSFETAWLMGREFKIAGKYACSSQENGVPEGSEQQKDDYLDEGLSMSG